MIAAPSHPRAVDVLLKVYVKCIDGHERETNDRSCRGLGEHPVDCRNGLTNTEPPACRKAYTLLRRGAGRRAIRPGPIEETQWCPSP